MTTRSSAGRRTVSDCVAQGTGGFGRIGTRASSLSSDPRWSSRAPPDCVLKATYERSSSDSTLCEIICLQHEMGCFTIFWGRTPDVYGHPNRQWGSSVNTTADLQVVAYSILWRDLDLLSLMLFKK
uniref:Uncharacterized protein n=1 Tax=Anguilla anguilla TaxID=7936 RepID=A0A0E9WQA7_ANGAN